MCAASWSAVQCLCHAAAAIQLVDPPPGAEVLGRLREAAQRVDEPMAGAEVFAALLHAVIPDPSSIPDDPRTGFRRLDPSALNVEQREALEAIGRAPVWDVEPFFYGRLMDVGLEYGFSWDPKQFRAMVAAARTAAPGGPAA